MWLLLCVRSGVYFLCFCLFPLDVRHCSVTGFLTVFVSLSFVLCLIGPWEWCVLSVSLSFSFGC